MALERRQQDIHEILKNPGGIQFLRKLTAELNYDFAGDRLPTRDWAESAREPLAGDPQLFATAAEGEFHVIYTPLKGEKLMRGAERQVVNSLLDNHPYALFVFSNSQQDRWHLVNVRHDASNAKRRLLRRIAIGADERLRTASERIAMLDLETINQNLFGITPLEVQSRHDEAFNVELVTKQFFNEYKSIYDILQDDLKRQTKDRRWAHDYALQFLNRCMFLYFIQRKRWLGDDTEFLNTFWRSYQRSGQPTDTFFEGWLQVLFFEAFNNRKSLLNSTRRAYIPEDLRHHLRRAPYLNGGLYSENDLDRVSYNFRITDSRFKQILDFLERYNFTIAEDSPLDQEVAVDPEMIGKVYESLVNVSTEADERGDAGIFYTPRTEIDLMCRLALVDHLTNVIGAQHRNLLYEMIFALEPHEKEMADVAVRENGLWSRIETALREVTGVDPACGSGSFLVGLLHVLDDLQCRASGQTGNRETAYERKRRIIGQSLYGVDVMPWAAHIAELRMWLALIIDAEFTQEELSGRDEPLLPYFSFKIRSGDSLVQEVGGLSLSTLRGLRTGLSAALRARVTNLKKEKLRFYNNETGRKFKSARDLEQEELNLFRDLLDDRRANLDAEIHGIEKQLERPVAEQIDLLSGEVKRNARQLSVQDAERVKRLEQARVDLEHVRAARRTLKSVKDVPFVWDIAFVEIFSDERCGFSIVVGNPPYVRQEAIADPRTSREEATVENKRAYKAKLQRAVYQAFPHFFGYDEKKDKARHTLDAKSDLYIYFYFLTLPLLDEQGAFCFITSNSWLDVGYGADLQEFLLRRSHVHMVIDNATRRSFESAEVNTIITLLTPPVPDKVNDAESRILEHIARFVMFKTAFENVLSPVVFEEIEEATERKQTNEYRVFPIKQKELLEDGMEMPDDEEDTQALYKLKGPATSLIKIGRYIGNKWGGKYLRAPEIYWIVIEKGAGKLVRLGNTAEVKRGITTGANEFFYLNDEQAAQWEIEEDFLESAIKSPKESKTLAIHPEGLKSQIFMCNVPRKSLRGTNALDYIKWGESQGFHQRPTCASRGNWWSLGERRRPNLCFSYLIDSTARTFYAGESCYSSDNFQDIFTPPGAALPLCFSLNSTIFQLMINVSGRANFGGGLMKIQTYEVADLLCLDPAKITSTDESVLEDTSWDVLHPSPERYALDEIVFDALNLTRRERRAVYEAVIELVEARLSKASSLKPKNHTSKRLQAVERTQGIWQDLPEFEDMEA